MNWLANDPPSPQPTESSFCALGRYAKLSLLLSNYKYCHKPTIRAHNIPPAPSRSSYMNTSYCGPLTFASAADQKLTLALVQAGNLDLVHALSVVYPVLYGVLC